MNQLVAEIYVAFVDKKKGIAGVQTRLPGQTKFRPIIHLCAGDSIEIVLPEALYDDDGRYIVSRR